MALSKDMIEKLVALFGTNSSFVLDMYEQYTLKPESIKKSWVDFFRDVEQNKIDFSSPITESSQWYHDPVSSKIHIKEKHESLVELPKEGSLKIPEFNEEDHLGALVGAQAKIVQNMTQSLSIPTATSVRNVPVIVLDENRRIMNQYMSTVSGAKVAFTHIIAWAIVKALVKFPSLNSFFAIKDGKPYKIQKDDINLGLAIDLPRKDGSRMLVVPSIKKAQSMDFKQLFSAYNAIVSKARTGKLDVDDFQGTTASLTNPGTLGTVFSFPRLMNGQGIIVATGAIDYATEFQAMNQTLLSQLGISKIMTLTNTYDHRIIQGAESGAFLGYIHKLLLGEDQFYYEIFSSLSMPYKPWSYSKDQSPSLEGVGNTDELIIKQARVLQLINAYRVRGHLIANTNPLYYLPQYHLELDPDYYGFTIWDLDREFIAVGFTEKPKHKLRDIIDRLRSAYCDKIGVEYMYIQSIDEKRWLQNRVEPKESQQTFSPKLKQRILSYLLRAEQFERYLHTKFLGHKRFSVEGAESVIAILDFLIDYAGECFTEEVVFGMSHRGRINVLANIIGKPYHKLFAEFIDKSLPMDSHDLIHGSGDVKYHLGASGTRQTRDDREVKLWLASNPSHLEAVCPVVEGVARAKQDQNKHLGGSSVLPVLLHGDAAFSGQGVVAETFNLSQLEGYTTKGTIHIVINNQIGFTTVPHDARSSHYATDVAKMVQAPVFHVNGDDPEACIRVTRLALDYRLRFNKDVVIDLVCYRKHGHNEGDDPSYTQPKLYNLIKAKSSTAEIYAKRLLNEATISQDDLDSIHQDIKAEMDEAFEMAKKNTEAIDIKADPITLPEFIPPISKSPETLVSSEILQRITKSSLDWPDWLHPNPKLAKQFRRREALLERPETVTLDWAFAETLAFGSLLLEGFNVRLSGQDSTRGTFSQRHLALFDMESEKPYIPLQHLDDNQGELFVYDSMLSEAAVMGFEFGYSIADPKALVIWEAQFGDFVNGAQVIIDQFLTSSESKWGQCSGLVLLLPHGYEGQGPEHSSARMERFLQQCANANMQLCNCTTPAQYFHLLRRQVRSGNLKPLIIMTPKSLLRNPQAVSPLKDFTGDKFHNALDDSIVINNPRKVILCSGKIYYDLIKERQNKSINDVAIIRLEQIYPYPRIKINVLLNKYQSASKIVWAQEEPRNMGAWHFVSPMLSEQIKDHQTLEYAGRDVKSSPASGRLSIHEKEQSGILSDALS